MTKQEFITGYAVRSQLPYTTIHDWGVEFESGFRVQRLTAQPCDCGESQCEGWQMVSEEGKSVNHPAPVVMPQDFIYCVAYFRWADKGPEYGFKRCHLHTFYWDLDEAREKAVQNFDDEAGWYLGILIEKKYKGKPYTRPYERVWYYTNDRGQMVEIPEPEWFQNHGNLIG